MGCPNEGRLLKQMGELGFEGAIIGIYQSDNPVILDIAGEAAEGVVYPEYSPAREEFVEKFKARYGEAPVAQADYAYDAVKILARVMREYGTSTEGIQEGLLSVKNYEGMSGTITLDEFGDRVSKDVYLKIIKDGKGVILE